MPPERILFVGLGNYTHPNTRHNAGMLVLDYLAQRLNLSWAQHKPWKAHVASTILTLPFSPGDQERSVYELTLLKPRLLMNVSGSSVARAVRDLSITGSNVYVFHDDLQRDLGKASLKRDGSANGHNGIKSTIQNLKTDEFWRVRIGIGRPVSRQEAEVADYVLSKFSAYEMDVLAKKIYPLFDIGPGLGLETLLLRNRLWEFPKPPKKKKTKVQPNTSQLQQQQQQQAQTVNQTENQTSATSPPDIAVTA